MRTYIGLSLNKLVPGRRWFDRIDQDSTVEQKDAMRMLNSRVSNSVWAPSWPLREEDMAKLIGEAIRLKKDELTSTAASAAVEALQLDHKVHSLAENTLILLAQFRHGTDLKDTFPTGLVALHDGETGCWALITVNRTAVDVRVRNDDLTALQNGTGRLLALLDVVDNQHRVSKRKPKADLVLRVRPGELANVNLSHKDGSFVGGFKVTVLGGGGRLVHAVRQPLPRALWVTSGALLFLSALLQWVSFTPGAMSSNEWFPWWHDLANRVFTTVLWAAAFATIQVVQSSGRPWRTSRGGQVRIHW